MKTEDLLRENERIDDLEINGFRIIQNPFCFCFGMDAVLLANFANIRPSANVIDLGTGTGIVPMLLAAKGKGAHITGLEVQENMAEMATRSAQLNEVTDKVDIVCADVKKVKELFRQETFEAVTSNPPYIKENTALKNDADTIVISRHEVKGSLDDFIGAAAFLLKTGGSFTMVHRPSRLPEIMDCLLAHRLEPKRMQLVQPHVDKPANMVLIEAVKNGGQELKLLPTLVVYNEDGSYTDELLGYYGEMKK